MNEAYWLKVAKNLPVGISKKVRCCSDDRSASASHTEKGYVMHCFRCKNTEFEARGTLSISDINRIQAEIALTRSRAVPDMFKMVDIAEAPEELLLWYLQCGVSTVDMVVNGVMYDPNTERLVLPVKKNGEILFTQSRSVRHKPKYINSGDSDGLMFIPNVFKDKSYVVVVEDILSAIKISRVCPVVSTLGTSFSNKHALDIMAMNKTPVMWYDNDKAGRVGCHKAEAKLDLMGIEHRVVRSEQDPKYYNREMIERELDKCLTSYYFA